jgi:hypothetical protein
MKKTVLLIDTAATDTAGGSTSTPQVLSAAAQVLLAVVPSLTPYGLAIDLAFTLAEKVAPEIYVEIKNLIAAIQNGGTPTADEIATLQALVASLESPEGYFKTPIATAEAAVGHVSPTAEV